MITGYRNFVFRNNVKLFFYRVGEFLTLLWIFFVFIVFMIAGNV